MYKVSVNEIFFFFLRISNCRAIKSENFHIGPDQTEKLQKVPVNIPMSYKIKPLMSIWRSRVHPG